MLDQNTLTKTDNTLKLNDIETQDSNEQHKNKNIQVDKKSELKELKELFDEGLIDADEYKLEKQKILSL